MECGAGTVKTILAVFLLKLISDLKSNTYENTDDSEVQESDINSVQALIAKKNLKIGFVVPQQSLRETLKKVFGTIRGLSDNMIMTPAEAAQRAKDEPFDLLVCDEAHRLRRREALSQYPAFDKINIELDLPRYATELDWIIRSSRMQLLFYDAEQSVRPSDITKDTFREILNQQNRYILKLSSQLRCRGGNDYVKYVKEMLNTEGFCPDGISEALTSIPVFKEDGAAGWESDKRTSGSYRFEMYEDLDSMMDEINRLDKQEGLCCAVAGYAWKWITRGKAKDTPERDIPIGKGYIWNRTYTDWINSDRLPYEVGCIHTVQGYDLNYVGVIFGPEIVYRKETERIEIIKENYKDNLGKAVGDNYEALRKYILNIYATLLTRGIHGALVYVCDPALRKYLQKFIPGNTL